MNKTCGTTENQNALPCQPECEGCRDYAELQDIVLPAPHEAEDAQ